MADRVVITTGDLEHAVRINAQLESAGFETALATSADEARQAVVRREPIPDCLVLTGGLHEPSAAQLLVLARDRSISTLGLVESTEPDSKGLARRLGLTAFLEKPADPAEVVATVRRLIERRRLQQRTGIIGESSAIQEVLVKIEQMAPVTSTVLIEGESGTGKELVARGRFRAALFSRLNVLYIYLPPLRERRTDIPLLVRRFIAEFAATHDREFRGVTPEALQILVDADWPGNVRQLRNLIESMVVLAPEGEIRASDIPRDIRERGRGLPVRVPGATRDVAGQELEFIFHSLVDLKLQIEELRRRIEALPKRVEVIEVGHGAPPLGPIDAEPAPAAEVLYRPGMTIAEVERAAIEATLRETKGNRRRAAEILGIGERTLYRKIKEYALA